MTKMSDEERRLREFGFERVDDPKEIERRRKGDEETVKRSNRVMRDFNKQTERSKGKNIVVGRCWSIDNDGPKDTFTILAREMAVVPCCAV